MNSSDRERILTDVWDWPIRVLHWVNAALIVTLALLMIGKEGMEILGVEKALRAPVKKLHAYVGHLFVITFLLRVLWGFIGNEYSRWLDIIPYNKERWRSIGHNIKWYLSGFRGRAAHAVGHDPFASLFYIVLFIVLTSQIITGVVLSGHDFKTFPGNIIVAVVGQETIKGLHDVLEGVHVLGFYYILFFVCAHLGGLVVHEIREKTGLFSSMIHGGKYFRKE